MASAAQPSPPFVPIKTSWSAREALRVTITVLQSAGEALFVNGTENLRHALGAARPLPAVRLDGKVVALCPCMGWVHACDMCSMHPKLQPFMHLLFPGVQRRCALLATAHAVRQGVTV